MERQTSDCLSFEQQTVVEEFWHTYSKRVFLYIYLMLGRKEENREIAKDYTNDTFLRAMGAIQRGNNPPIGGEDRWFFTIAKNLVIDKFRKDKRHPTESLMLIHEDGTWVERDLEVDPFKQWEMEQDQKEARQLLQDAVAVLPNGQRKALEMRLEGSSYKEIGARLQIPLSAVKKRLYDARQKLAENLQRGGEFKC